MNFYELAEKSGRDFWDKPEELDTESVKKLIKRGLELRPDRSDGKSFWDDFAILFGQNAKMSADLFGIRPEAISRALNLVRKITKEVSEENDTDKRAKRKMINTGLE